jgi:hypothetical protein
LSFSSYRAHWQQLNDWLLAHRALWQPAPFTEPDPGWTDQWPELARHLADFSDDACQRFEQTPLALVHSVADWLPSLREMARLTAVPEFTDTAGARSCTLPETSARDMPGRKRLQSGAFVAALRPLTAPVIDWCCGKGHLARTFLPFCDFPVAGFEWDPALVEDGNRLARKAGDSVTVHCQNVMAENLTMPADTHGVALHACGDLHRKLIGQAGRQKLSRLSVAPCCFHKSASLDYQPLSQAAQQWQGALKLTTDDLKLAVEETVTAPTRVRRQVKTFSQWRLGFDGLQRALRQTDEYLPVPSHPGWVARGDFKQFCQWAADRKQLTLPQQTDYLAWEAHGVRRLGQVRRYELVRHLFRRPLELWLVLDYAVFLEEQDFSVRLGTFCERDLTPRNLLIDSTRKGLR